MLTPTERERFAAAADPAFTAEFQTVMQAEGTSAMVDAIQRHAEFVVLLSNALTRRVAAQKAAEDAIAKPNPVSDAGEPPLENAEFKEIEGS